jgi:hypothetical protein
LTDSLVAITDGSGFFNCIFIGLDFGGSVNVIVPVVKKFLSLHALLDVEQFVDDVKVDVPEGVCLKTLYAARLVLEADVMEVSLSSASVVLCYLSTKASGALKPKFESELKPGSRVVMESFPIPGWKPARTIEKERKRFYLYRMPPDISEEHAGGDPLLFLNRTINYAKALKKAFGKKFHIHIYLHT